MLLTTGRLLLIVTKSDAVLVNNESLKVMLQFHNSDFLVLLIVVVPEQVVVALQEILFCVALTVLFLYQVRLAVRTSSGESVIVQEHDKELLV